MSKTRCTLADMVGMEGAYLVPEQVADVLGCSGYAINVAAKKPETRERLGFPVIMIGSRCKIPRIPFLHFMGVEVTESNA